MRSGAKWCEVIRVLLRGAGAGATPIMDNGSLTGHPTGVPASPGSVHASIITRLSEKTRKRVDFRQGV